MHHALPSVCGCHFARLYPEYARICEANHVRLNTRRDLADAWATCVERVFELSSPEHENPPPKWATSLAAYLAAPTVLFAAPMLLLSALLDGAAQPA